jgi:CDP-paratose 2-epimerase
MKQSASKGPVLITGGAGFIGANLANHLLCAGEEVLIYDNLSRAGVERNWQWLHTHHGNRVHLEIADTRNPKTLRHAVRNAKAIFHFAAQVAVTTSLDDPAFDFEVNALGTLNLLHAWRELQEPPPLIYTSTNKVYGSLSGIALQQLNNRYEPADAELRERGINEEQPLEFYSPYGCSKGSADQYVLDHARTFGLPALVFRMSCIYGPHQFGTEDQGWVAHFLIKAREGETLTFYGDGHQVRDILFVDDLVRAFCHARENLPRLSGQAFNIGGGPRNSISLKDLLDHMEGIDGRRPAVSYADWRPGDQRYYVTDFSKFTKATGWQPQTSVTEGLARLSAWLETSAFRHSKQLVEA